MEEKTRPVPGNVYLYRFSSEKQYVVRLLQNTACKIISGKIEWGHALSGDEDKRLTGVWENNGWYVLLEDLSPIQREGSKKTEFYIGQEVIVTNTAFISPVKAGMRGTVASISENTFGLKIGVFLDLEDIDSLPIGKKSMLHSLDFPDAGDYVHKAGWWFVEDQLAPYTPQKEERVQLVEIKKGFTILEEVAPFFFPIIPKENPTDEKRKAILADRLFVPIKYRFVARDLDGKLFAYPNEPILDYGKTQWWGENGKKIDDTLFSFLTFQDKPLDIREIDH